MAADLTIEILKALRKEMRERFDGVDKRLHGIDTRLHGIDTRLVAATLLTLARQQRLFAKQFHDLDGRVGKLERR